MPRRETNIDRPLSEKELKRVEKHGGNAMPDSGTPSEELIKTEMPATYRQLVELRTNQQVDRMNKKHLIKMEDFVAAHKDLASTLFGVKLEIVEGLMAEMRDKDEQGNEVLNTLRVDTQRLALFYKIIESVDKRAFGAHVTKTENTTTVTLQQKFQELSEAGIVDAEVIDE